MIKRKHLSKISYHLRLFFIYHKLIFARYIFLPIETLWIVMPVPRWCFSTHLKGQGPDFGQIFFFLSLLFIIEFYQLERATGLFVLTMVQYTSKRSITS